MRHFIRNGVRLIRPLSAHQGAMAGLRAAPATIEAKAVVRRRSDKLHRRAPDGAFFPMPYIPDCAYTIIIVGPHLHLAFHNRLVKYNFNPRAHLLGTTPPSVLRSRGHAGVAQR